MRPLSETRGRFVEGASASSAASTVFGWRSATSSPSRWGGPDWAGVSHVYATTARPLDHPLPLLRVGDPDKEMAMKGSARAHQHGAQAAVPQVGDKFLFNRTPALFAIGVERDHVMSQRDAEGLARSDGVGDRSPAAILIVGADIHGTRLGLPNSPN